MGNLISGDTSADKLFVHDGFSTTITDSFNVPSGHGLIYGMDFDGENLIINDSSIPKVTLLDGISNTIVDSFTPSPARHGVTWDGTHLITTKAESDHATYRHDGFSATVTDSFSTESSGYYTHGIVYYDGDLWSSNYGRDEIYHHDGFSATVTSTFSAPATRIRDLSVDGGDLYSCDSDTDTIYRHDGFTSTILDSISAPGSAPESITFDARWVVTVAPQAVGGTLSLSGVLSPFTGRLVLTGYQSGTDVVLEWEDA